MVKYVRLAANDLRSLCSQKSSSTLLCTQIKQFVTVTSAAVEASLGIDNGDSAVSVRRIRMNEIYLLSSLKSLSMRVGLHEC